MASKIKSLTIVSQQGVKEYVVGEMYNGLILQRIEDKSAEFPDSIIVIYIGFTVNNNIVFEAINAPIEVQYEAS